MAEEMLVDQNEYMYSHMQAGTMVRTPGMSRFISKRRGDGLYLLKLEDTDARIAAAAKMLARYEQKSIVVTASRVYAMAPAKKFAEITGVRLVEGRVMPGVFTNPNRDDFFEPEIVLVSDTRNERQAVKEASKINVPVVALCDTDNWIKFVDMIIPCNNKSRRSIALVYWLLAREFLKEKGEIKSNDEFKFGVSDFEAKIDIRTKV
ncbi:MAG: 30S ribosomal protein S2 [Candidatus Marsarchaeota archaeon]|nr:30S ribosomal protein S2 [Candidatus Marsarchaeota archaeon]